MGCQSSRRIGSGDVFWVSAWYLTNTVPGKEDENRKWWYCFIPGIFLKRGSKMLSSLWLVRPLCLQCARAVHTADLSMTSAISAMQFTGILLKRRLNNPKQQSGLNFVCPTTKNEYVMLVCHPVITLHILSSAVVGMKIHLRFTQTVCLEEVVQSADNCVCPFSYLAKLICEEVYIPGYCLTVYPKN